MKSNPLDNLRKHLDSEEGQKMMKEWFEKEARLDSICDSQLERFKIRFETRFAEIIEKIQIKYTSNKYRDGWYKRHIEPPESLYFFLFDYAAKYGREATEKEFKEYGNMFTIGLYFVQGFFFNKMNGQGTVVQIKKQKI